MNPIKNDPSESPINSSPSNSTGTSRRWYYSYLWIFLLLIIAIILCILISLEEPGTNAVSLVPSNPVKDSENFYYPPTGFYEKLEGKSIDESIQILRTKSVKAKEIVPFFPDFPSIWLISPQNKGRYASLGERYCIEFLELVFPGHKFCKIRPRWLRNPETNYPLELDGYCEELKLAIEYNGVQHYVWPNFTGQTREEFIKQRQRDKVKESVCTERNVCLIRVPYTVPLERIPIAIYAKLLEAVPGLTKL